MTKRDFLHRRLRIIIRRISSSLRSIYKHFFRFLSSFLDIRIQLMSIFFIMTYFLTRNSLCSERSDYFIFFHRCCLLIYVLNLLSLGMYPFSNIDKLGFDVESPFTSTAMIRLSSKF